MSPTNATVRSLAERRVRRQKIFIAAGSVVLLAVLGFQLPKLLGGNEGQKQLEQALSTALEGATSPAATPAVAAGELPGTDRVVVRRDSNQLISFGLFKTKDPFIPQVTTTTSSAPPIPPEEPPTSTTTPTEPTPPLVPVGTPATGSPSSTTPGTTTPSAPPAVPTDALIATNGLCERIAVQGTFPITENIFRLVSVAKDGKSVQIGIVGGSFDNGQPTATLKLGDKLTLVNTADGTRYVIELKAKCAEIASQAGASLPTTSPQSVPATPVAPAPAPTTTTTDTVTTPIVTDAEDTTTTTTTTTTPSS